MIQAAGLKEEQDSPFFIENKRVCEFWDRLIEEKGGTVNGKYTAWSLMLIGQLKTKYDWHIQLKKSTSSGGNLFISSNKLVFEQAVFEIKGIEFSSLDFSVHRSSWTDFFKTNIVKLNPKSRYVLEGAPMNQRIQHLIVILKNTIQEEYLEKIQYSKNTKKLIIDLRTLRMDSKFIEQLLILD